MDENDVIRDVKFEGSGCAISTASASIMSQALKGQTRKQAEVLFQTFHYKLTWPKDPAHHAPNLCKLAVIAGVFTVPGDGCVDYPSVLRELPGYSGWAVVEAEQDPKKAHPLTYAKMGYANISRFRKEAGLR